MFESSRDVDIIAKFLTEAAFEDRPMLTIKVEFLIDLLQCLGVRLKSESSNVWDCPENVSDPNFTGRIFPSFGSLDSKVCSGSHQIEESLSLNCWP
jgi:hypothetical protein